MPGDSTPSAFAGRARGRPGRRDGRRTRRESSGRSFFGTIRSGSRPMPVNPFGGDRMSETPTTRPSLLVRLRDPQDERAWAEFVGIYTPLVYRLARRKGFQD